MNPLQAIEMQPHVVVEWLRDGTCREWYFPTRHYAEAYLAYIPVAQAAGELREVVSAEIRPAAPGVN